MQRDERRTLAVSPPSLPLSVTNIVRQWSLFLYPQGPLVCFGPQSLRVFTRYCK